MNQVKLIERSLVVVSSILFCLLLFITPASAASQFNDIPRDHWAYNEIGFLSSKGVINGFSDGSFKPLATITRKDAAIMLVRAMKLSTPSGQLIIPNDMKPTMSGYNEVIIAINSGMFSLSGKNFNPNDNLTRREMAKAIAVAYEFTGARKSSFSDLPKSDPYYKFVDAIAENEITTGYKDGTFKPDVSVNRAQYSVFLARIYNKPLEYIVRKDGRTIHTVRDADEAINLAVKTVNATVHPVSNSLMRYSDSPAEMKNAGIKNGVLIYNGAENTTTFTPDFFKPYISFLKDGKYSGSMFDSFIILGRKYSASGEFAESKENHANYKEWKWYINQTFSSNGALTNLNKAAKDLGKKVNVHIAIPYPKRNEAILALDGKKLENTYPNRYNLVEWYMKSVEAKWKASRYTNLVFKGYYWQNETVIHLEDEMLIERVAKAIHAGKKSFVYSPHALTTNFDRWKTYGLDGAYLQPNAFRLNLTNHEARLHKAFLNAQIYGSGINLEIDTYSPHQMKAGLENFKLYLTMAHRYKLRGQSLILYQGLDMLHRMATYNRSEYDEAYELLYELLN